MPFTTILWEDDIDPGGAFVPIPAAAAEQHVTALGNDIVVPELTQLVLAAAGAEITAEPIVRLESPSLRDIARLYVSPLNVDTAADVLPADPPRILDRRTNPFVLTTDELLEAWLNSNPGAGQIQWVAAWLADAPIAPLSGGGEIMSLRWAAAQLLVAEEWTNSAIVFDEALPVGKYQVVGFRAESATLIAARLVFKGQPWRPGCLGNVGPDQVGSEIFRHGGMGVWGEFQSTQPPNVDFFAQAADAAEAGFLDLVKVG